jgi:hypothetical protein
MNKLRQAEQMYIDQGKGTETRINEDGTNPNGIYTVANATDDENLKEFTCRKAVEF